MFNVKSSPKVTMLIELGQRITVAELSVAIDDVLHSFMQPPFDWSPDFDFPHLTGTGTTILFPTRGKVKVVFTKIGKKADTMTFFNTFYEALRKKDVGNAYLA